MKKRLTITIDASAYDRLRREAGPRNISRFIETLVTRRLSATHLDATYAEMSRDQRAEAEALEWADALIGDALEADGCDGSSERAREQSEEGA